MLHNKEKKSTFLNNVIEFVFLLTVVFLIRTYLFGLYQVPTGSMETTMLVGERFLADKCTYLFRKPLRGEIIAFNDPEYKYIQRTPAHIIGKSLSEKASLFIKRTIWEPLVNLFELYIWGPSNWTKRVIAIPGDTVRGEIEEGKPVIYVNGQKIEESYINKYPLIRVWKEDPEILRNQIEHELKTILRNGSYNQTMLDRVLMQKWAAQTSPRSYDPSAPFDKQPFYRIIQNRIITDEDGAIEMLVPGTPLHSQRAKTNSSETKRTWNHSDEFYIELGEGEYWCMGDNRLGSHDCRFFGPVKEQYIHGRIIFRIWSVDSDESWWILDLIKHPIDFWTRIRWSRCLQWVY